MSEKRYEFGYDDEYDKLYVYDTKSDSTYNLSRVVNLLNAFDRECTDLLEENEKLIQKKCPPCKLVNLQTREIDKLKDENEQLKQINNGIDELNNKLIHENNKLREQRQCEIKKLCNNCDLTIDQEKTIQELKEKLEKIPESIKKEWLQ